MSDIVRNGQIGTFSVTGVTISFEGAAEVRRYKDVPHSDVVLSDHGVEVWWPDRNEYELIPWQRIIRISWGVTS